MPGPGGMFPMPEWEENPIPWQEHNQWGWGAPSTPTLMPKVGQTVMPAPTWGQEGIEDFIRETVLDQNPDWMSGRESSRGAPPWRVGQQEYADDAIFQEGENRRELARMNREIEEFQQRAQDARDLGLESDISTDEEVYSLPGPNTIPWNPPNPPGIPFGAQLPGFGGRQGGFGGQPPKPKKLPTLPTG